MRRVSALARHDLRLIRSNPLHVVLLVLMPLLLMAFLKGMSKPALVQDGITAANGSEQAVPGMTTMFAFYVVGLVAAMFFEEHALNTWPRLRATEVRRWELVVGKSAGPFATGSLQLVVLFTLGGALFGLRVAGSLTALVLVGLALLCCFVGIGLAVSTFARSWLQVQAANNLGALLFAGMGGALTPRSTLPEWAQEVSILTPTYWAMTAFRRVIVDGGGVRDVLGSVVVLGVAGLVLAAVAAARLKTDDRKMGWR